MPEQVERRLSFSGGEMEDLTVDRIDIDRYTASCLKLVNFTPLIKGAACRRPGSIYFDTTFLNEKCRLIPFIYSSTTNRVLVFGNYRMRVINTSGTTPVWEMAGESIFEMNTPWGVDELQGLQFARVNDLIYVTHPLHRRRLISRNGIGDWSLSVTTDTWPTLLDRQADDADVEMEFVTVGPDTVLKAWRKVGGVYVADPRFLPGHVNSQFLVTHRREDLEVVMNLWNDSGDPAITDKLFCLGAWSVLVTADAAPSNSYTIKLRLERSTDGINWDTHRSIVSTKEDPQVTYAGDESEPCFLRIKFISLSGSWPSNGAADGNVNLKATLEVSNPDQHTIAKITAVAPDGTSAICTTSTPPFAFDLKTRLWQEPAWSGVRGHPRSICFHENRIYYGGSDFNPQTVWASRIDRFADFRVGSNEDLGFSFRAVSDNSNLIQWLSSGQRGLAVGTFSEEWMFTAGDGSSTITPNSRRTRKHGATGSSHFQPLSVRDVVLFVGSNPRKLYEFTYDFSRDSFLSADLTLFLEIEGGIHQMAVQTNPDTLIWVVTNSGKLLILVYDRVQGVSGWARVETQGTIESVAIVPSASGAGDQVWLQILRELDGVERHFLEHLQPDQVQSLRETPAGEMWREGVFTDCSAVRKYEEETSIVTGLEHLEGKEVQILADGSPYRGEVVGGSLTLPIPAKDVIVGLQYISLLEPTWFEGPRGSSTKVAMKRITRSTLFLWRSIGGHLSSARGKAGTWNPIKYDDRGTPTDEPRPLFTGVVENTFGDTQSTLQTTLTVRQDQPLPLNITSIYARYEVNQV